MFVKNFGLFWQREEVEWNPGTGRKFRLLGRNGKNRPGIRLADFQDQQGIYILYGNYGAYYVGLATHLGQRLKDHLNDDHQGHWVRFSWFGFRIVLNRKDDYGLCELRELAQSTISNPELVIKDVEALLIRAMGLSNINQMSFYDADEWEQIERHEVEYYFDKIT